MAWPIGPELRLRRARGEEAAMLSELAMRSKAYWGYGEEFMSRCRVELTWDAERMESAHAVVAERAGRVVGFYIVGRSDPGDAELEAIFVEPVCIGQGVGRHLIEDALRAAASRGAERMLVQSDPHAAPFYRRFGGEPCGTRPSGSIPGRALPLFWFPLAG